MRRAAATAEGSVQQAPAPDPRGHGLVPVLKDQDEFRFRLPDSGSALAVPKALVLTTAFGAFMLGRLTSTRTEG